MNRLTLGPDTPDGFYWIRVADVWDICEISGSFVVYLETDESDRLEEVDGMDLWGPIEPPSAPEHPTSPTLPSWARVPPGAVIEQARCADCGSKVAGLVKYAGKLYCIEHLITRQMADSIARSIDLDYLRSRSIEP